MYFTVCAGPGLRFKMFQNTLYKSIDTLDTETNILWPVKYADGEKLRTNRSNGMSLTSYIRRWNDKIYNPCKWSFSGSSLEVTVNGSTIVAPVITMTPEEMTKLPSNDFTFVPKGEVLADDQPRYLEPHLYSTDPTLGKPMPVAMVSPMPVAMVSPLPVAMVSPLPVDSKFPPHLVKIVLADYIRKNESCPITGDPITDTATVTRCGHVFSTEGINTWLACPQSKGKCPVCKQSCYILF